MFITTSDFTADALSEATNDPSKPVVAINGKALVMSCIDNSVGCHIFFNEIPLDFLELTT